MYDNDAIVLGGGPAGLAAATAAARRGLRVLLLEASRPPIDKACGEGLMPNALAAARRIGAPIPESAGSPIAGIRFCDGASTVASRFPGGMGLGVRRTVLHQQLIEHAAEAGVDLAFGERATAIEAGGVRLGRRIVTARWIVGADGSQSSTRRWAGLEQWRRDSRRFGFRVHFQVAPWSEFVEVHWGDGCQFYVTPVAADEVCVVVTSRHPRLRLREALGRFPDLEARLGPAAESTTERGSPAGARILRRVAKGNVALVGDASGSVDAITGEGLCQAFQQAEALAEALAAGRLDSYESAHRQIMRRPLWMGGLMLALDRWPRLRRRVIPALASRPRLFENLLSVHAGEMGFARGASTLAGLTWGVLTR